MNETPADTSAESASKIMGRACIRLDEVLELFPEAKAWVNPDDYRIVPFSPKILFHLSGHQSQYVLLPAIPFRGKSGFVNVSDLERFVKARFPAMRIDPRELFRVASYALNNNICPQKWYLLSANVLKKEEVPRNVALGNAPAYRIERSLIYLYAWALFRRLRGRSLFKGRHFICSDIFSAKHQTNVVLLLKHLNATVYEMARELNPKTGKVPSILPTNNSPLD
ncbi:MAG: hypothetical protein Q8L24_00380 [bacterium]|nr:hypothetical protein [bacterium]